MTLGYFPDNFWVFTPPQIPSPTLAIVDNADGTGAVATISTTDAAATNTVWYYKLTGDLGSGTWTSGGSRVGNGTMVLALGVGIYRAYCRSVYGASTVSTIVDFVVTSGSGAVYDRILDAVQAKIRTLNLAGVSSASVVVRQVPIDRGLVLPAIVIAPQRDAMAAATNLRDAVTYGVYVFAFRADNQAVTIPAGTYTLWRERIAKAFRHQRLEAVAEVATCTVEPYDLCPYPSWLANLLASGLVLRFTTRETRGI